MIKKIMLTIAMTLITVSAQARACNAFIENNFRSIKLIDKGEAYRTVANALRNNGFTIISSANGADVIVSAILNIDFICQGAFEFRPTYCRSIVQVNLEEPSTADKLHLDAIEERYFNRSQDKLEIAALKKALKSLPTCGR